MPLEAPIVQVGLKKAWRYFASPNANALRISIYLIQKLFLLSYYVLVGTIDQHVITS